MHDHLLTKLPAHIAIHEGAFTQSTKYIHEFMQTCNRNEKLTSNLIKAALCVPFRQQRGNPVNVTMSSFHSGTSMFSPINLFGKT